MFAAAFASEFVTHLTTGQRWLLFGAIAFAAALGFAVAPPRKEE